MREDRLLLLKNLVIFDASEAHEEVGVSRHTLSRWTRDGRLQRVGWGLYIHPDCPIDPAELDFAVACKHFGEQAAIAGASALFYYGLIAQVPQQVWLVVQQSRKNRINFKYNNYKCLRTAKTFKYGITKKKHFKITSIERTIVESLWFSTKLGQRLTINAARASLVKGMTTERKIGKMAEQLDMQSTLARYWESIVS